MRRAGPVCGKPGGPAPGAGKAQAPGVSSAVIGTLEAAQGNARITSVAEPLADAESREELPEGTAMSCLPAAR